MKHDFSDDFKIKMFVSVLNSCTNDSNSKFTISAKESFVGQICLHSEYKKEDVV